VGQVSLTSDTNPAPTAEPRIDVGLPVDWALARRTAARLVPAGPPVSRDDAVELVRRLRSDAAVAEGHVRAVTGLGEGLPLLPADVVDRPAWAAAAIDGMAALTAGARLPHTPKVARAVTATTAGLQVGGVLAYLGGRVLGQYDPFGGADGEGRLLLVAPNVYAAQQALNVPSVDFGMWVCLHEATHRLQFTAVPWLREHFSQEVGRFLSMAVLDRLLALTTLLEGHADHVMDAAGPDVVPSVETIRARFTLRRRGGGLVDRLLRALLGVEAKVKQYAVGSAFTKYVVLAVGMDGFNRVWESPQTLPSRAELADPAAWLERVG